MLSLLQVIGYVNLPDKTLQMVAVLYVCCLAFAKPSLCKLLVF